MPPMRLLTVFFDSDGNVMVWLRGVLAFEDVREEGAA